jgi:hypothetical protein
MALREDTTAAQQPDDEQHKGDDQQHMNDRADRKRPDEARQPAAPRGVVAAPWTTRDCWPLTFASNDDVENEVNAVDSLRCEAVTNPTRGKGDKSHAPNR